MEYNEEIAKEIAKKYRLSEVAVKIWESNDNIPDHYLNTSDIMIDGMDLRQVRKFLGYTFQMACLMLAKNGLKVSRVSLSQWERGKVELREKNRKKIIEIYKKLVKNKKQLLGI